MQIIFYLSDVKHIWNNSYLNCGCRWKWRMIIAVDFPIWAIGKKKPEKIRASTGFEPVTFGIPVRCSTNWAVKPHLGSEVSLLSSCLPWGVKWREVYNEILIHIWTADVDESGEWWSFFTFFLYFTYLLIWFVCLILITGIPRILK